VITGSGTPELLNDRESVVAGVIHVVCNGYFGRGEEFELYEKSTIGA